MSEQEVQARAADAARANVESHYNYIAASYAAFVDKWVAHLRVWQYDRDTCRQWRMKCLCYQLMSWNKHMALCGV